MDKQELLADPKYSLNKFDFQQAYTSNPEDDQTSYVEKKIFKFQYRRALDSKENYERRNQRMVEEQKKRFQSQKYMETMQNYVKDPEKYEADYLAIIQDESLAQYKDYFKSENDEFDNVVLGINKIKFTSAFQNWQLDKQDRSGFQTFPLEWNNDLGLWSNALNIAREVQKVGAKMDQLETSTTTASLSTSALQEKR